jgi:hypothetical protein
MDSPENERGMASATLPNRHIVLSALAMVNHHIARQT